MDRWFAESLDVKRIGDLMNSSHPMFVCFLHKMFLLTKLNEKFSYSFTFIDQLREHFCPL